MGEIAPHISYIFTVRLVENEVNALNRKMADADLSCFPPRAHSAMGYSLFGSFEGNWGQNISDGRKAVNHRLICGFGESGNHGEDTHLFNDFD